MKTPSSLVRPGPSAESNFKYLSWNDAELIILPCLQKSPMTWNFKPQTKKSPLLV